MDNILEVKDLSVDYDGRFILENINFQVEENDFVVIFGENGSGKSSLVKTILSLKTPAKGSIKYKNGLKSTAIGYLPQCGDMQSDFPVSVFEVVLAGCLNSARFKPFLGKKEKKKAMEKLELMGVADLKDMCFSNLSGGQKQRVLLARALCSASKLLLLDEPTAGLDPIRTVEFYELAMKINKQGIAIIMVSHDVHSSLSVAKHVLQIGNRTQLFFGTSGEYDESSNIMEY